MKKLILISMVLGLMATPALAVPTVTMTRTPGTYDPGIGTGRGEYTLTPSPDLSWVLDLYDAKALVGDGFESFCVETGEHATPGQTYIATLLDRAIAGGVGPQGDPMSTGTAWLYHEFQKGTLEGYDYDYGPGRVASACDLQLTIWYLEDEVGAQSNDFTDLLIDTFGSISNAKQPNNGVIPVAVLNLHDRAGNPIQDFLVCVPAPGAVLLGGIGVGLVGWLRRRRTL